MKLNPELLTEITEYINAQDGAHLSGLDIAQHFNVSSEVTNRHLHDLVELKLIHMSTGRRPRSYSKIMPKKDEIVTGIGRVFTCSPLKVDNRRQELYAEIAADRQSMRSIG
jgi:hypothetical protein